MTCSYIQRIKEVEISKTIILFSYDLDLDPMTLIFKLELDMIKMYLHAKNEVSMSSDSKGYSLNRQKTQTHRQTDTTKNITYPHTRVVMSEIM